MKRDIENISRHSLDIVVNVTQTKSGVSYLNIIWKKRKKLSHFSKLKFHVVENQPYMLAELTAYGKGTIQGYKLYIGFLLINYEI
jgi:hypothetical protein